jgi:SnoaL-like domain
MTGVVSIDIGTRLLDALERRDYEALGSCFAPGATLRSIVPPGLREDNGRKAIVARFRRWTDDIDEYELLDAETTPYADLLRIRWAVSGLVSSHDGERRSTFEQTAYAEVDGGVIAAMRLACSGHRPAP